MKKGREEGIITTARNMMALVTISLDDISKITGLTLAKIKELAA